MCFSRKKCIVLFGRAGTKSSGQPQVLVVIINRKLTGEKHVEANAEKQKIVQDSYIGSVMQKEELVRGHSFFCTSRAFDLSYNMLPGYALWVA